MVSIIKSHSKTIDLIRGISAIFIVLYHYTCRYNENAYVIATDATVEWPIVVNWGYGAVVTFFMLSGFLLAKNMNNPNIKANRFLSNRLWRLYPTYWISMTITAIIIIICFPEASVGFRDFLINLTMIPGTFKARCVDGAYWTMAYEVKFAIVFSLLLFIRNINIRKLLLLLWLSISIAASFWAKDDRLLFKFIRVFLIADWVHIFIIGLSIFQIIHNKDKFYCLLLCLCVASNVLWSFSIVHGIFILATSFLLFFVKKMDNFKYPRIIYKPIAFVALISYPLYLLHQMIGFSIIRKMKFNGMTNELWIIVPISVSVLLAYIVHKYIEYPSKTWPKFLK